MGVEEFAKEAYRLVEAERYKEASEAYEQILEVDPNHRIALVNLGIIHVDHLPDPTKARGLLERAIELYPDEGNAHYSLGVCEACLGNHPRAIELYAEAIRLNRNVGRAHNNSGNSYFKMAELARSGGQEVEAKQLLFEAFKHYGKAIEIIPDFPLALRALAACLSRLGFDDEAIRYYNRALTIVPTDLVAWKGKFRIYAKRGDHDKLLEQIETLRRWCGGLGSVQDLLRSCEAHIKDLAAASKRRASTEEKVGIQQALDRCADALGSIDKTMRETGEQASFTVQKEARGVRLPKPWSPSDEPLDKKGREGLLRIKELVDKQGRIVGESAVILRAFERIQELVECDNAKPVVLLGETGVGKTFLVPLIVASSKRTGRWEGVNAQRFAGGDFNITKGELVGYAAHHGLQGIPPEGKKGLLEYCNHGTIFIDELGSLSLEMQRLLLTILDGAKVQKVGALEAGFQPDVRFIFATNREPLEEVAKGNLEHDLWRRLCRYCVTLPSLRGRKEDIPLLAGSFLGDRGIETKALLALMLYEWPGNVGELKTVLDNLPKRQGGRGTVRCPDLPDEIARTVGDMGPAQAESELVRLVAAQLRTQGFEPGKGLNKELARRLRVSEGKASGLLKQAGI